MKDNKSKNRTKKSLTKTEFSLFFMKYFHFEY